MIVIVGAGPAGLACARTLARRGRPFQILEASERIGGRVASEDCAGFRLDVGFQILLTSYPELPNFVNLATLRLGCFRSGALIRQASGFAAFPDPLREPWNLLKTLLSPVGSLLDKLRIARLGAELWLRDVQPFSSGRLESAAQRMVSAGFSEAFIAKFLRPFFGGVLLDDALETDSRMLDYLFERFSKGRAALPAGGMGQFARALGEGLSVRLSSPVAAIEPGVVRLASGETVQASQIVLAVDAGAADRLLGRPPRPFRSTHCAYFAAPRSPLPSTHLALNPNRASCIHHLCVPSDAATGYAPFGQSLVSVSTVGPRSVPLHELQNELRLWFGEQVELWRPLRSFMIPQALASFPVGSKPLPLNLQEGLWQCGDQTGYPSLNCALETGRRVGEGLPVGILIGGF